MTSERWEKIQALFEEALRYKGDAREQFLTAACGDDDALHKEVVSLLEADTAGHSLFEGPALEKVMLDNMDLEDLGVPAHVSTAYPEGTEVGPYRLLSLIGEGGMGVVYKAERADGLFDQKVALKFVKRGMDTAQIVRRFQAERQILARLQHDNIARLFDGGVSDDGLPYFAMEFVDGIPIDQYCDTHRLSIDERLDLFAVVCKAVLYAHANLVVHRDLKPENILVTADRQVKLLDFGIAKLLDVDDEQTQLTQVGHRVLTPGYASPEQLAGNAIGTSSDIYSLGVVLYELLAGQRPFDVIEREPNDPTEPQKPSTLVEKVMKKSDTAKTISSARNTHPDKLRRRLSGDLDVICLKSLRHDPDRRYRSVEAFADDIQRHRDGLPVLARPDSVGYRFKKFVGRHQGGVVTGIGVLMLIVSIVSFYTIRLAEERDAAQLEAEKASEIAEFLQGIFEISNPSENLGDELTARELLERGAEQLETELADQPEVLAEMLATIGQAYSGLGDFEQAVAFFDRATEVNDSIPGASAVFSVNKLRRIGYLNWKTGDYAFADSVLSLAQARNDGLDEPDTYESAEILNNLAILQKSKGNYPEAESLYLASLAVKRTLVDPDHIMLANLTQNLGSLYISMRHFDKADSFYQETLRLMNLNYEKPHPNKAIALFGVGRLHMQQGDLEKAEAYIDSSLTIRRAILQPDHPDIGVTLTTYADILHRKDMHREAIEKYREAAAIYKGALDNGHPARTRVVKGMARAYQDLGEADSAEVYMLAALDGYRARYGPVHRLVAVTLGDLATMYRLQKRHPEAQRFRRQSLEMRRELLGDTDHTAIAVALNNLGVDYMHAGQLQQAEETLNEALVMRRKLLSPDDINLAETIRGLGNTYALQRRFVEAESLLVSVMPTFETKAPNRLPGFHRDMYLLYKDWERPDMAEQYKPEEGG